MQTNKQMLIRHATWKSWNPLPTCESRGCAGIDMFLIRHLIRPCHTQTSSVTNYLQRYLHIELHFKVFLISLLWEQKMRQDQPHF